VPFTEDLTVFFQTAEFATACTYKAGGVGGGTTINVIFDAAFIEHLGITGTNPVILARSSDVPSFSNSDTFTINGVVYRGVNDEPKDDGAIVMIQLQKTV
jgi:hypothetical protein